MSPTEETGMHEDPDDRRAAAADADVEEVLRGSQPNSSGPQTASGDMGVSSERVGPAGPDQHATDGLRDTTPGSSAPEGEDPPEQAPGAEETNPDGRTPKAGYSSIDPRSD